MLNFLVATGLLAIIFAATAPALIEDLATMESKISLLVSKNFPEGQLMEVDARYRWPNKTIPWDYLPSASNFSASEKAIIMASFQEINAKTCVKFVQRTTEVAYVNVGNNYSGCFVYNLGYVDETWPYYYLNLESNSFCFDLGTRPAIHEMGHILGLDHEHVRYDRDCYIRIIWQNISKDGWPQFTKRSRLAAYSNLPYDFKSIMHYTLTASGKKSIEILSGVDTGLTNNSQIGYLPHLSASDVSRINSAYKCN
ncbi:zinc metalloproteinase nas-7-like [Neocloeon triangulifer]|uniref:zinc metalloproteinase nas-7-like n=1 Tax=Neocloeon triangulifer TaxID=2078957 RepID=UPI00286F0452|nr:zinc metalloproteinase nas-7-like [Neocloeon triangulifer]